MSLSSEEWQTIDIVVKVTGALSIMCSLATVATFFTLPPFRAGVAEIVLYSALAELICIPGNVIGRNGLKAGEDSALCQWQAFSLQFADLAAMFCTACIATDLLLVVLSNRSLDSVTRLHRRVYLPICVLVPLTIALAPMPVTSKDGRHFYGDAVLWCWISNNFLLYRFYLFYIPLWTLFLFNLTVYLLVGRVVWKQARTIKRFELTSASQYKQMYAKRVSLYLLVFLLIWIPPTINRIYSVLHPTKPDFTLNLLHAITQPALGILNFTVYMYVSLGSYFTSHSTSDDSAGYDHRGKHANGNSGPQKHPNIPLKSLESEVLSAGETTVTDWHNQDIGTRDFGQTSYAGTVSYADAGTSRLV